jgi:glycosyltransferase involved in cell wall biosynthesis
MRVLYFAPKECWPTTTGARLRNYHLARVLALNARVTYLAFSDDVAAMQEGRATADGRDSLSNAAASRLTKGASAAEVNTNGDGAAPGCDRVILVPQERSYTPIKLARGALGRIPVTVLNYTSRAMAAKLESVLNTDDFDVVQVESIQLAAYLPIIRAARNSPLVICDWHNIESDLMRQYGKRTTNPLRRTYARRTASQLEAMERRVAREADANVMVSEPDRARLRHLVPGARAFVIENGVDVGYYTDEQIESAYAKWRERNPGRLDPDSIAKDREPLRHRVLFVGSMDYHANIDGAVHFARSVWPQVLEFLPNATLTIVGRNPAAEVRSLADLRGIEVTGTVEDVRPYYREALASVVPLNVGGGSRLKISEGMAAGVPIISTRRGAEGVEANDGESIVLAETANEFCQAIQHVAKDNGKWQQLVTGGRRLVSAKYDWTILGAQLSEIHSRLIRERDESGNGRLASERTS